jgi:hypothetical protein
MVRRTWSQQLQTLLMSGGAARGFLCWERLFMLDDAWMLCGVDSSPWPHLVLGGPVRFCQMCL